MLRSTLARGKQRSVHRFGRFRLASLLPLLTLGVIAGCGSVPRAPDRGDERGAAIAHAAAQLVGTPYHFGGADTQGFDCSGLVFYVHQHVGVEVPRTAEAQRRAAHPVTPDALLPGDVVFFRTAFHIRSHRVDHVGIYAGDDRFIHAPRFGETVSYATLKSGYYRKHFVSGGRFWDGPVDQATVNPAAGRGSGYSSK